MRRTSVVCGLAALFLPLVFVSTGHGDMPPAWRGVPIVVSPGSKLTLRVTYQCADENCVELYLQRTGERLTFSNSHRAEFAREWTSPVNTSNESVIYFLSAVHKESGPDGSKPWCSSGLKVFDQSQDSAYIGFADRHNGYKYNSATATIKITKD